jgi:hypothetical protein
MSTAQAPRPNVASTAPLSPAPGAVDPIAALWARRLAQQTVLPVVRRETLVWSGGRGGTPLEVAFDAENPSDRPTRPVQVGIGVATFGAFIPSRVAAVETVPMLLPGGRRRVSVAIPASLLPAPPDGLVPLLDAEPRVLQWAGNIDVWMEGVPHVERHAARLTSLTPGVLSLAHAVVQAARRDELAFTSETSEPGWAVRLSAYGRDPIEEGTWVPAAAMLASLFVGIRPPLEAEKGAKAVVTVTRRSDAKSVPIEFTVAPQDDR